LVIELGITRPTLYHYVEPNGEHYNRFEPSKLRQYHLENQTAFEASLADEYEVSHYKGNILETFVYDESIKATRYASFSRQISKRI